MSSSVIRCDPNVEFILFDFSNAMYANSRIAMSITLLLFLNTIPSFVNARYQCYYRDGTVADGSIPYDTRSVTHCCELGKVCLMNGLCLDPTDVSTDAIFSMDTGACTNVSWQADYSFQQCPQCKSLKSRRLLKVHGMLLLVPIPIESRLLSSFPLASAIGLT